MDIEMRNVNESKAGGRNDGTLKSQESMDAAILARMGKKQVLKVFFFFFYLGYVQFCANTYSSFFKIEKLWLPVDAELQLHHSRHLGRRSHVRMNYLHQQTCANNRLVSLLLASQSELTINSPYRSHSILT